MAEIVISIPDAALTRVIDALSLGRGYPLTVFNEEGNVIPNPVSKTTYAKDELKSILRAEVRTYEAHRDATTATQTALGSADAATENITVT